MATAAVAVVLVFLLTFSSALDQQTNDFLTSDRSSVSLPDANTKTGATILLPTERPESEQAAVVETQPEETQLTDSESHDNDEKSVQVSEFQTDSLPLTTVFSLRPVNRRFSRVPFFPIRRGFKCHGRHRHHRGFAGQRQISFGNDMIVAKDLDPGFDPANTGDGQRPERWAKFNHGEKRSNDEASKQEMYKMFHGRPHFHHHHRHNHRHHHGGEGHGIFYSIRKFLNF